MRSLVASLALIPTVALAQQPGPPMPQCMPWPQMLMMLKERFNETIVGGGLVNPTTAIQVLTSWSGATWTILEINTGGNACIIKSGTNWDPGKLPTKPARES